MKKVLAMLAAAAIGIVARSAAWEDPVITDCTDANQPLGVLSDGSMSAKVLNCIGNVSVFTNGVAAGLPFETGICLDTGSRVVFSDELTRRTDSDLISIVQEVDPAFDIGGHVSAFEFEAIATSELLSFHYAYASCEFDQASQFSDPFALLISVNGSEYENLARLDNNTPVSIRNLRAGRNKEQNGWGNNTTGVVSTEYFTSYPEPSYAWTTNVTPQYSSHAVDGISVEFKAEKAVSPGDKIKIKFVIADTGDTIYDSFVFIKAESLGFAEIAGAPIATEATDVSKTGFVCNWYKVTGAVSYQVDVATDPDFANLLPGCDAAVSADNQLQVTGSFPQDSTYYYRVRAVGSKGTVSPNSNVIEVVIPTTEVAAPTISPEGCEFTGSKTVTIINNHPGAVLHYTTDGFNPTVYSSVIESGESFAITTNTVVKAIAIYKGVNSAVAAQTYTLPPPVAPPTSVQNVKASDGSSAAAVEVTWTAPAMSSAPVTGYEISRKPKSSGSWTVLATNLTNKKWTDYKAEPGVDYTYRVRAKSDAGWGGYGSDDGWRAVSLSLSADSLEFDYTAGCADVTVSANAPWDVIVESGVATAAKGTNAITVSVPLNAELEEKTGFVTVAAGLGTDHPASATVNVTQGKRPALLTKLEITGGDTDLEGGEGTSFKAIATFDDGTTADVTDAATWSITDGGKYGVVGTHTGKLNTHETTDTGAHLTVCASYTNSDYAPVTKTDSVVVNVGFTASLLKPLSVSISGNGVVHAGETRPYIALVHYNNGTSADRTLAPGMAWKVTPGAPNATLSMGASAAMLTPKADGITLALSATYTEAGTTVSGTKSITVPLKPPAAPLAVAASDGTSSVFVEVTWNPPTSGGKVDGYDVYRATAGATPVKIASDVADTSYMDVLAEPGIDYTYSVVAKNAAGEGSSASDTGWRAVTLDVALPELTYSHTGSTKFVDVESNTSWDVYGQSGIAKAMKGADAVVVSVPDNTTLESKSGTVVLTAGAGTGHPVSVVISVIQEKFPLKPLSVAIEGADSIALGEVSAYVAKVEYNNGTTVDVTLDPSMSWTFTPGIPKATFEKGADAMMLCAYSGGMEIVLNVEYTSAGETVSATKAVTVPATVTIPVAVDMDAAKFTTGGTANANEWHGQTAFSNDGVDAAQSGKIFGDGATWMSTTVTNAGTLSFWWLASCEPTYDTLKFSIDGLTAAKTSGTTNDWRRLEFELASGVHELRWTYSKDAKKDAGKDCGFVDGIVWKPLAAPAPGAGDGALSGGIVASDGTFDDCIEVEWCAFASDRPVFEYELSRRASGDSAWTVVSCANILRFVDSSAAPGVDYTYRVRARNEAGWGEFASDDGWRACSLAVDPASVEMGYSATTATIAVDSNVDWTLAVSGGGWLSGAKTSSASALLTADANISLDPRNCAVTFAAGAGTAHGVAIEIPVVQSARPPEIDVGFVKYSEVWRTRMQIASPETEVEEYEPVSVFAAGDPLEVSFGWTNRSEIALAVPAVKFRLYSPGLDEPISEWTVPGRTGEVLAPGKGGWSGGWPIVPLKALAPGDYRLEAEIAPDANDINRVGDLDSDLNDNIAIFRFAVRDPSLDVAADIFSDMSFVDVECRPGNDFAQPCHAVALPGQDGLAVQFGPYVPMNGKIGHTASAKAPLDLVFLIDVTGSMSGCIDGLKTNIKSFFTTLVNGDAEHAPITDWRAKVVGYRDITCDYSWYEDHGFTTDVAAFNSHIAACNASAGGDIPESLLDAVWKISKETEFRENASRAIVIFTDASCKSPMSYGAANGKGIAEAAAALVGSDVVIHVISSESSYTYGGIPSSQLVDKVNALAGGTDSTYLHVGSLSTASLNPDMLSGLAKTVSSAVKETKVVEPVLSFSTCGKGTLSFDWINDATDTGNNTFVFTCASVTNISNVAGTGWQHVELDVEGGWHLFQWMYGKRDYRGAVSDCGRIANIEWNLYDTKLAIQPSTLPVDYLGYALAPHTAAITNFEGEVVMDDYFTAVSNLEYKVDAAGNVTNIVVSYGGKAKITCNSCWKTVGCDDWIRIVNGSGEGDGELVFEIAENTNYFSRTGFITVRAGEYGLPTDKTFDQMLKIVQDPRPYTENGSIQIISVDVKPRWPWNQTVDIDFRVVTPEKSGTPVKIYFTGVNNEGGDTLDYYPALKNSREVKPGKGRLTTPMPDDVQIVSGTDTYCICKTSGLYRVSWTDMSSDWYAKYPFTSVGSYAGWKQNGFHTPAFSVRLKVECAGKATVELPSKDIRLDLRVTDKQAAYSGGAVMSGAERIGHPEGKEDPVERDSRDKTLFPDEGWNKLDFVENLAEPYSNNYTRLCVINDAYVEGGVITTNTTWRADKVHIVRDNVFVHKDAVLTIEDGAVVKFCFNTFMYIYKNPNPKDSIDEFNIRIKGAYLTCAFDDTYGDNTLFYNIGGKTGDTNEKWNGLASVPILSNATSGSNFLPQVSSSEVRAATRVSLQYKANGKWISWKDRFYSRGQHWGVLPYPSEDGMEFYGWYCNDPATWLTTDLLASKYPASKAFMISASGTPFDTETFGAGTTFTKVTKHFRDGQIFALLRPKGWADSAWDSIDASGGKITLSPSSAIYDGKEHKPGIASVSVNDSVISDTGYSASYGEGDYVAATTYLVGVDFTTSDYSNSPTAEFVIEPRAIDGGEILFSNPTNNVMYLPALKKPTMTVHLPNVGDSAISDAQATADCKWKVDMEPTGDHVWPEVGDYMVVASYEDNPNYTGGALTNIFTVSVNPDYVFTECATLDEVEDQIAAFEAKYGGREPRVLVFSGRTNDVMSVYWKKLIRGNTAFNNFVTTNFVCWADDSSLEPSIGVRDAGDLLRDIVETGGVMTASELFAFLQSSLTAAPLPLDISGATLEFTGATGYVYDGTSHYPAVRVVLDGEVVSPDVYALEYSGDGVDAGDYSVRAISGEGVHATTTAPLFYAVAPKPLKASDVTLEPGSAVYDGAMHKPAVSAGAMAVAVDYGTGDFTAPGAYPVTVTAGGNHTGTVVVDFVVTAKSAAGAVVELDAYSAEVKKSKSGDPVDVRPHVLRVRDGEHVYEPGIDYDIVYSAEQFTEAGVYAISAVFKGCYSGTVSIDFPVFEGVDAVAAVDGDPDAEVAGDDATGYTVKPSAGKTEVVVTVPDGVDPAKITVQVSTAVEKVSVPSGTKITVVKDVGTVTIDITEHLDMPEPGADGAIDMTKATVKAEIVEAALDVDQGAEIALDPADPKLTTSATKPGLKYTLREGALLKSMKDGDSTVGNGGKWSPKITVKGGASGFYTIKVEK